MLRRALEEDVDDADNQVARVVDDEQPDDHADDGVGDVPLEEHDQDGGDNDADRAEQVAQHVLESALHIQALSRRAVEYPCGAEVDEEAADADQEHGQADHLDLFREGPMVGLEEDPPSYEPQRERIDERGQYLRAVVPESALHRRFLLRDPHGHQRHCNGSRIGEHVSSIGEQRQAPGQDAAGSLRPCVGQNYNERYA